MRWGDHGAQFKNQGAGAAKTARAGTMVRIERVHQATPFAPERVIREEAAEASAASPPKLLKSLEAVEKRMSSARDKSHLRETYLVENGVALRALKAIEAKFGPAPEAAGPHSHAVLESYLRSRFMVFDKTGTGHIDMSDFTKLLGLIKDGRHQYDLEKELTKIHVNDEGKVGYFEFIQWWLREDEMKLD